MNTVNQLYANKESQDLKNAIAPFVASFGFKAHDQNPPRPCSCSCFFVIINGHWAMCTAAHVMDDIRKLQDDGVELTHWHINDLFMKEKREIVYPFNVTTRDRFHVRNDELGLDYLLVYVDFLTAQNLTATGVRAIGRELVGDASEADKWIITGFPSSFTKQEGSSIGLRHYIIGADPIDRPENWESRKNEMSLFGKLDVGPNEDFEAVNIGGMSGGPIFGLFKHGDGTVKVKLVGVQSGWSERSRIITACPIEPFLDAIDTLLADDGLTLEE